MFASRYPSSCSRSPESDKAYRLRRPPSPVADPMQRSQNSTDRRISASGGFATINQIRVETPSVGFPAFLPALWEAAEPR
jgi:hypothetical protein